MIEFKTVTNIYTGELTDSHIVNAKEIEIIKREVSDKDIALDIGANVGFMTTILAEQAEHVYAFEPEENNFKRLEENTKHLENVDVLQQAISDDIGFKYLYLCPQDPGMHRLYDSQWCKDKTKKVMVSTSTLDFWMQFIIGRINFIKLDVEGYEYYAIRGMEKLLQRDHPTILIEWHPPTLEEAGTDPAEFYWFMRHELKYDNPINVNTNETITTHNDLDKQTRDQPAVNILWKYNNSN
jgi:FkbM family methyltransferase